MGRNAKGSRDYPKSHDCSIKVSVQTIGLKIFDVERGAPINYDKVGQARKGACILNLLAHLSFRFIEAPFADENTPHFSVKNSIKVLKWGVFWTHSPKNYRFRARGLLF